MIQWSIVDMSIIRYQLEFNLIMGQHVIGFFSLSQFKESHEIHHSGSDKNKQCILFLSDNVIKTAANPDNS